MQGIKLLKSKNLKGNCAQTMCMVTAQNCSRMSDSFVPKQVVFLAFVRKPVPPLAAGNVMC